MKVQSQKKWWRQLQYSVLLNHKLQINASAVNLLRPPRRGRDPFAPEIKAVKYVQGGCKTTIWGKKEAILYYVAFCFVALFFFFCFYFNNQELDVILLWCTVLTVFVCLLMVLIVAKLAFSTDFCSLNGVSRLNHSSHTGTKLVRQGLMQKVHFCLKYKVLGVNSTFIIRTTLNNSQKLGLDYAIFSLVLVPWIPCVQTSHNFLENSSFFFFNKKKSLKLAFNRKSVFKMCLSFVIDHIFIRNSIYQY